VPRIDEQKLRRAMDANFNRAKEGLRVCEDICRFVWDEKALTKKLKLLRHELTEIIRSLGLMDLIRARDVAGDVGEKSHRVELKRNDAQDVFYANMQRSKESIRVLEEVSKILNSKQALRLKKIRYQLYALEKTITE
jgi:thiamine-phosphate pyrophosphorylase